MREVRKKIGMLLNTKHIDIKSGVELSKSLNIDAIQLYAFHEKENLATSSKTKQKHFKEYFSDSDIKVASLAVSFGPRGILSVPEDILLSQFKQFSEFGLTLGTTVISAHIGKIPLNTDDATYERMMASCYKLGAISNSLGCVFAIETGSEQANTLSTFLRKINSKGLGVNFDPANIVMGTNENPIHSLHVLKDYIVQTHLKDCIKTNDVPSSFYKEMAVGKGEIDFNSFFSTLNQNNYKGYHIIESSNPVDMSNGISQSVDFLHKII